MSQPSTPAPVAPALADSVLGVAKAVAAVVVAALVVFSFLGVRKPTAQQGDFGAYYRAGQSVVADRSPYTLDPHFGDQGAYMYCPAFAHLVCRPLAHLSYLNAKRVFVGLNWVAAVGVVALSLRLAGRPGFYVGVIACIAVGPYLWANFHNGQVGTLLLLACLGWVVLTIGGQPFLGGMSLSLAVGLKIYPLLLGPYLLLRRRWWPGLLGLAAGLAVQFALPAVFVGPRAVPALHREWIAFCLHTQSVPQTIRWGNDALLGVLARTPWVSDGVHVYSAAHLATLERLYPAVVLAITAAVFALILVRRRGPAVDVPLLLVWVTLAAPRAWTFNLAAELPAAVLLAVVIVHKPPRWPWALAALLGVLVAVGINTNGWLNQTPTRWALGPQLLWDKHFLAAVALVAAVVFVDPRPPTPSAALFPANVNAA